MAFKRGNKLSPGGKIGNKGGGRTPDWLKEKCQGLVDRNKLVERLAKIGAGLNMDFHFTEAGEKIPCPAPIKAQIQAISELLDRGHGKPAQSLEVKTPPETDQEKQERADRIARRLKELIGDRL